MGILEKMRLDGKTAFVTGGARGIGKSVAAALCDALEAHCRELGVDAVTVHASKTALPFFLGRGYAIEREQQVPCRGQVLTNYALEKIL